jgi:hypothetical protein
MKTTTIVMASAALALFACSKSGFNTPTLLNKPRVLAIQADPPQPALGASTTLSALVYPPPESVDGGDAGAGVTYSWSWCPLPMSSTDPSQCPIGQDVANQLLAGISDVPVPLLDLGPGERATFTNPFPAPILASLCERKLDAIPALAAAAASNGALTANGGLSFACTVAGFPITVTLVVHTSPGDPAGDLPAVFNVYLPINDNIAANLNPVVNSISVTVNGSDHQLDQADSQGILSNSKVPVILGVPLESSELLPDPNVVLPSPDPNNPYLAPNDNPFERLDMSWYAECGDFGGNGLGGRRTGYLGNPNDPNATFDTALRNTWNIPKPEDYRANSARIIVVVRDGRGGVAWVEGSVHLGDTNSAPDGGGFDSQETDSAQVPPAPDGGMSDSQEADSADVAAAPDAGAPDAEATLGADAIPESTP